MKQHLSRFIITAPVLGLLAIGIMTATAHSALTTTDPTLPPITPDVNGLPGGYLTPADVHAMYSGPGLAIVLSQVIHQPFSLISRVPGPGGSEIETFQSTLDAMGSINEGPLFPIHAEGPVMTRVEYGGGGPLGVFATEMLSLELVGPGLMIRESPTLQSTGITSVNTAGPGLFQIDSFFDVFTELSLDGGASWMPNIGGPTHVELEAVPEPGTLLWGTALGLIAGFRRARTRRA